CTSCRPPAVRPAERHPLDPLTADEMRTAVQALKSSGRLPEGAFFPSLTLHEPPKQEVLAFQPGKPFRREAVAVVLDRPHNHTFEGLVDLGARRLLAWKEIPNVQPPLIIEEYDS